MSWEGLTPPYRTVVADPPWPYPEGFSGQSRTLGKWEGPVITKPLPYSAMTLEEIASLPLRELGSHVRLFLWTTNRYLPASFGIVEGWGFRYRQTLAWHKRDALAGSLAPNLEFVIAATRGTPGRMSRWPQALFQTPAPKVHSRKPAVFADFVEAVSPGPYVELFARQPRFGWDSWGHGYEDLSA